MSTGKGPAMSKSIAVLVRERQGEALRVALGLTLADNRVEIFVLDRRVTRTPESAAHLEALRELGISLATTCADNADFEQLTTPELARRILRCDHILPY